MWWRRKRPPPDPELAQALDDATSAAEDAAQMRAEAEERWPQVRKAADQLRRHREVNHFSDALIAIFRGQQ